jgi:dTDP-4-dehydrorhamnose 3,5-epimerase-like enzyme
MAITVGRYYPPFMDERGMIQDLLRDQQIDGVTLIRSNAGAIRGNHYHQETTQWTYVLSGRMRVVQKQWPNGELQERIVKTGQMMMDSPGYAHAWQALELTEVLVMTQGPRTGDQYESDTYRLRANERLIP